MLMRRLLSNIPDKAYFPQSRRIPAPDIWLTHSPKVCPVNCDNNSLGVTFVFATEAFAGGDIVIDKPVEDGYQLNTYDFTAGKIVGGSWG